MIITVTPNPSIDRTVTLPARLVRGAVHRVQSVSTEPGGKGVNVARALTLAGLDTLAILPAGGRDPILSALQSCGVPFYAVPVDGAVRTNLRAGDLPDSLRAVRLSIEAAVPVGFSAHDEPVKTKLAADLWEEFPTLTDKVQGLFRRARTQLGTLGGGNHFFELCLDAEQQVWIMLHSGSRNIGKELAEIHMARAKKLAHNRDIPDRDLSVFLAGTPEMDAYRRDLFWAQRYARANRELMLELALGALREHFPQLVTGEAIFCHHNYVSEETHYGEEVLVTRKGAIRAGRGELGIIPGSMGTRSYIVRGLGCAESFESASHGAGRKMSRGEAKRRFSVKDLIKQTEGIECRKDSGVLDEIPGAYKSIERVMESQADLVEVVSELRQVLCIKG